MRPALLIPLAAAAAAAAFMAARKRAALRDAGSPTNASAAVDDIALGAHPTREQIVDEAVQESFPASDAPAVEAGESAYERKQAGKPAAGNPAAPGSTARGSRSPDWLTRKP